MFIISVDLQSPMDPFFDEISVFKITKLQACIFEKHLKK